VAGRATAVVEVLKPLRKHLLDWAAKHSRSQSQRHRQAQNTAGSGVFEAVLVAVDSGF